MIGGRCCYQLYNESDDDIYARLVMGGDAG